MKKLILLLLLSTFTFVSCSDNNDNEEEGYLTSLENVKSGIIGVWKSTTGGIYYSSYTVNGTVFSGFEPDGNWESSTSYEVLKSGSDYVLRIYVIGSSTGSYTDWKIVVLDDEKLTINEIGGDNRISTRTRVN